MNKRRVDSYIDIAAEALQQTGIADNNGRVRKGYRGQISTFGAAVINGSLKSAIAFYSNIENSSDYKRTYLMKAICYVIKVDPSKTSAMQYDDTALYKYVVSDATDETLLSKKENITDAAIALKLAMNLFELCDDNGTGQDTDQQEE